MRTRYIQDPETGELVLARHYYEKYPPPQRSGMMFIMKCGLPERIVSPVDGSILSTRRDLENHNAKNEVIPWEEYGPNPEAYFARKIEEKKNAPFSPQARAERIEVLKAAMDKHEEFPSFSHYVEEHNRRATDVDET